MNTPDLHSDVTLRNHITRILDNTPVDHLATQTNVDQLAQHLVAQLAPIIDNIDRNARAYGWEIGRGHTLTATITSHEPNPFHDPDWRLNVENRN